MIKEAIQKLVEKQSLTLEEAAAVMEEMMEGKATPSQLSAFLTALRIKGETADEIAGLASVMRAKAIKVTVDEPVLDIVGTGADGCFTFNISTAAALVAAGAGIKVAKHGNRVMSSQCGSADVLEALGVKIDLNAERVERCIEEAGIGFMFAQSFHPAMKYVAPIRRELGFRTVFNILGPLTNPARADSMVIGVPDESLGEKIALTMSHFGVRHSMVVHGTIGTDEIDISGKTTVWEHIKKEKEARLKYTVEPKDFGLRKSFGQAIKGGTAKENANIICKVLSGEESPRRDIVVMNAAAGIAVSTLEHLTKTEDMYRCARIAEESIDSGRAMIALKKLIEVSNKE